MENNRVCPWWLGYLLITPLRNLSTNPKKMFASYIKPGMTVIDYGCAMGYFSLPMAEMVGAEGKVVCFDIQEKMIEKLQKRATKACLEKRIETRLIKGNANDFFGLEQKADFCLLFAVAHEVTDREKLFRDLSNMMKPGSLLYFAEPPGHVSKEEFKQSVSFAEKAGFAKVTNSGITKSHTVLLRKV